MEEETQDQEDISTGSDESDTKELKQPWLKPWMFKKGQSGNPGGRPKGSISLKEYARRYLMEMTEEEKIEFMEGLNKDIIWKMAEGMPQTKTDITTKGESINVPNEKIQELANKLRELDDE